MNIWNQTVNLGTLSQIDMTWRLAPLPWKKQKRRYHGDSTWRFDDFRNFPNMGITWFTWDFKRQLSVIFSPGILVGITTIKWEYDGITEYVWNETIVVVISIFRKPDFLPFENDFPILTTIHGEIQIWSLKIRQELVEWLRFYYYLYWSTILWKSHGETKVCGIPIFLAPNTLDTGVGNGYEKYRYHGDRMGKRLQKTIIVHWPHKTTGFVGNYGKLPSGKLT